jgi:hypothetical protein
VPNRNPANSNYSISIASHANRAAHETQALPTLKAPLPRHWRQHAPRPRGAGEYELVPRRDKLIWCKHTLLKELRRGKNRGQILRHAKQTLHGGPSETPNLFANLVTGRFDMLYAQ